MRRSAVPARIALLALLAPGLALAAEPRAVSFPASDGLRVAADLYEPPSGAKAAPFLLLMHQAGSSRAEYRKIAPRLADAGYTCLAIDQRAGGAWGGVENETAKAAALEKRPAERLDALRDAEGALAWRAAEGYAGPLALWGSSYSASLAFLLAGSPSAQDAAIVAFSPGDYVPPQGATGRAAAKIATDKVLIVAPESERKAAQAIYRAIPGKLKKLRLQPGGVHGSSTLYRTEAAPIWETVLAFLSDVRASGPGAKPKRGR